MAEEPRVDVQKLIQGATTLRSLEEFQARGIKQVKVINAAKIQQLIHEALTNVIDRDKATFSESERRRIEEGAKREFDELFRKYQDTVKSKTEIEKQFQGIRDALGDQDVRAIQEQLGALQSGLQFSEQVRIAAEGRIKGLERELDERAQSFQRLEELLEALREEMGVPSSGSPASSGAPRPPDRRSGGPRGESGGVPLIEKPAGKEAPRSIEEKLEQLTASAGTMRRRLEHAEKFKTKIERGADQASEDLSNGSQALADLEDRAQRMEQSLQSDPLDKLPGDAREWLLNELKDFQGNLARIREERNFLEQKLFHILETNAALETQAAARIPEMISQGSANKVTKDAGLVIIFDEAQPF